MRRKSPARQPPLSSWLPPLKSAISPLPCPSLCLRRQATQRCDGASHRPIACKENDPFNENARSRISSPRLSVRGVSKRLGCSRTDRSPGLAGGDYSITSSAMENMSGGISMRPEPPGVKRFELTLAFLARNGFVAHRGLPGHDGHEDSSLPEVLNPYGIS